MRSRIPALALAALIPALTGGNASAGFTTHEVAISDNQFTPDEVAGIAGDSVHWSRPGVGNPHNVNQDAGLFRSGEPLPAPIDFTVTPSAGRFHYFCQVHGSEAGGMDGVLKVRPGVNPDPPGRPFTIIWAWPDTDTGTAFDVQYRVDGGPWRVWKTDTEKLKGIFGNNQRPIRVRDGHTYSFRARSQVDPDTPDERSAYSPRTNVFT